MPFMKRLLCPLLAWALLTASGLAAAAPAKVDIEYQATRNGQPFATIVESYRAENGKYRIESVTSNIGVYALFGKRRLTSEGEVTAAGLKPAHFELHQGDSAKRTLINDFDWAANTLTLQVKGQQSTAPLQKGAQDLSSFIYQFMFSSPKGAAVDLPVTTGKKLSDYHYAIAERDVVIEIGGKKYKTVHLKDAGKDAAEDQKELWLSEEHHFLPIRLLMKDEKGAVIEQTLTSIHAD